MYPSRWDVNRNVDCIVSVYSFSIHQWNNENQLSPLHSPCDHICPHYDHCDPCMHLSMALFAVPYPLTLHSFHKRAPEPIQKQIFILMKKKTEKKTWLVTCIIGNSNYDRSIPNIGGRAGRHVPSLRDS